MESYSFGLRTIALRVAIEMVEVLSRNLRSVGIPIDGLAEVFVIINRWLIIGASQLLPLKKIHNAIFYHRVGDA